jgi:hypothetical protein
LQYFYLPFFFLSIISKLHTQAAFALVVTVALLRITEAVPFNDRFIDTLPGSHSPSFIDKGSPW